MTTSEQRLNEVRDRGVELLARACCLALLSFCAVGCVTQSRGAYDGSMTFSWENDSVTHSDNNYTNGTGVTWVSNDLDSYDDDKFVSEWGRFWDFLPFVGDEGYKTYASWSIAQEMHTPDSISVPNPPLDDQPYAGVLYVDSLLYARSERWTYAWELKLGVVGPASQAEHVQNAFHELIGSSKPLGWDTQLPNEPIFNVGLTAAHLLAEGSAGGSARWRLVPVGTVGLGTYFTGVGAGMYGEVGWNLVDALGGASLRAGLNAASMVGVEPVDGWSLSFFGGFGGNAVAHYLPLDGTVFRDSRSVDTKPFIGNVSYGFNLRHGRFALGGAVTHTSKAFDTQVKSAEFGALTLSWYF